MPRKDKDKEKEKAEKAEKYRLGLTKPKNLRRIARGAQEVADEEEEEVATPQETSSQETSSGWQGRYSSAASKRTVDQRQSWKAKDWKKHNEVSNYPSILLPPLTCKILGFIYLSLRPS